MFYAVINASVSKQCEHPFKALQTCGELYARSIACVCCLLIYGEYELKVVGIIPFRVLLTCGETVRTQHRLCVLSIDLL